MKVVSDHFRMEQNIYFYNKSNNSIQLWFCWTFKDRLFSLWGSSGRSKWGRRLPHLIFWVPKGFGDLGNPRFLSLGNEEATPIYFMGFFHIVIKVSFISCRFSKKEQKKPFWKTFWKMTIIILEILVSSSVSTFLLCGKNASLVLDVAVGDPKH